MGTLQCDICQNADRQLEKFVSRSGRRVSHHRMVDQEVKCGFGLSGVCCKLCSNGPCRISKKRPYGVCGASADTIAMRSFLRSVAAGAGCYLHVVENAARRLKEAAAAGRSFPGRSALKSLCSKIGLKSGDDTQMAMDLANAVLMDLRRPDDEKMVLTERLISGRQLEKWREINILPGGAKDEVFSALIKTSTNLNSDIADMAMHCLRLGISTGVYGLVLTNRINDILLGEPELTFAPVGLNVLDPECVNIMVTGHQQALLSGLVSLLEQPEIQNMASMVGAKGIKIVGTTCVGQDFQMRSSHYRRAFCGHAGNNFTTEAVLMTGCVDTVVSEFNCTLPGIELICTDLDIPMICLDSAAKTVKARALFYSEENRDAAALEMVSTAMIAYAKRAEKGKRENPMCEHGQKAVLTGVTGENLRAALGGSWTPLLDAIRKGKIKGITAIVGCSNLRAGGHDVLTVELTKRLIREDILVLSAGCTSGGLANDGLMNLNAAGMAGAGLRSVCKALKIPPVLNFGPCLAIGRIEMLAGELADALEVDLSQLPVVVSAPQWLEEQALADGAFALALGFPLHLGLAPFVTGSSAIVEFLTQTLKTLTGGYLFIEEDAEAAAKAFLQIIEDKREGMGLNV